MDMFYNLVKWYWSGRPLTVSDCRVKALSRVEMLHTDFLWWWCLDIDTKFWLTFGERAFPSSTRHSYGAPEKTGLINKVVPWTRKGNIPSGARRKNGENARTNTTVAYRWNKSKEKENIETVMARRSSGPRRETLGNSLVSASSEGTVGHERNLVGQNF